MAKGDGSAIYQQIAIDIAQQIVNGKFLPEKKLYGRSTLAGMYNVSSETVRKAVALLQDMNVLEVQPQSGVVVRSADSARNFIERFKYIHSMGSLQDDIDELLIRRDEIDRKLVETMRQVVSYAHQLKNLSPYNPIEVRVEPGSHCVGRTIAELRFWQNTGGTVVALRRGAALIVSPGPYAILSAGDSIVVVGNEGILKDVERYVNGAKGADAPPESLPNP